DLASVKTEELNYLSRGRLGDGEIDASIKQSPIAATDNLAWSKNRDFFAAIHWNTPEFGFPGTLREVEKFAVGRLEALKSTILRHLRHRPTLDRRLPDSSASSPV